MLPAKLDRYASIATLLVKYGRILRSGRADEHAVSEDVTTTTADTRADAEQLAADLEKLGPTFVKLAQLLSTRPELLPTPYLDALARLQDAVQPFPFVDVQRTIE